MTEDARSGIGSKGKQTSGRVKAQWGDPTEDRLDRIAGQRDQLAGWIRKQ